MNCYIVAVGGTGSRVLRSVVHLAAAGVFEDVKGLQNINVMVVDSDSLNGDKINTNDTLSDYSVLSQSNVFRPVIKQYAWNPIDVMNKAIDAPQLMNVAAMSDKIEDLYGFLYTSEERSKVLKGGFYSHTSIGSFYMNQDITDGKGIYINEWKNFFENNNIQPEDKIIIIGSVFGGTGASGLPTLARKIKTAPKTQNCDIAGILVGPYFAAPTPSEGSIIETDNFPIKSKIAIDFYDKQKMSDVFKTMYFIGEDSDKLMMTTHSTDGQTQKNKANVVELYSATAIVDFLNNTAVPTDTENKCVKLAWRGTETSDDVFGYGYLNNAGNVRVYEKMAQFFSFSVLYTKLLYSIINDYNDRARLKVNYKISDSDNEKMRDYCRKYIEWIRELITMKDIKIGGSINIDLKSGENQYTNWFNYYNFDLYDGEEIRIQGKIKDNTDKCRYMDRDKKFKDMYSENTPGFEDIITTVKGGINTASTVYQRLCIKDKNAQEGRPLRALVDDTIYYIWNS